MNNNFPKTLNMLQIVNLKESISDLLNKESKYIPVANVCNVYLKKLNEGVHEALLCNDFVNELAKNAIHESSKETLCLLNMKINDHKRDIDIVSNINAIQNSQYGYVVPMIESVLVDYMVSKTPETRQSVRQTLSLFEGIKEINSILELLSYDEYEEKTNKPLVNSSLNETMLPKKEKVYTEDEVAQLVESAKADVIAESNKTIVKSIKDIDTHIYLDSTIKNILSKTNNEGLKSFCEQYNAALNNGKTDEVLYESFISGISNWNYLNAVDTEMSALKERISKYQQEIDLKKILKIMESTGSYYIVPLIENVVVDYMDNKTMANKSVLKQRLQAFEYDPFVRDILNVVMHDQSINNSVYLGESVENVNNLVHTEKIYSPVQYIKENECVFNVKGTYYNRKGNTITKLSKNNIGNLSESFKTLCNLINHPAVKINELDNTISIYEGKNTAKISETSIEINNEPVSTTELENMANMSHLMNEHNEGFYAAVKMINENFNKIAYIDFVKRVAMNESNGKTVDVFRVKNNLFVTTIDESLGTSTFYRNVNPISCRTYINEHMQINVSNLFEDILPNQHAVLEGIKETDSQYQSYIDELNNKKEEFNKAIEENPDNKDLKDALDLIDDEIKEIKEKYDKFQKDSEKYLKGDEKDAEKESPDDVAKEPDDNIDPDGGEKPSDETPAETEDQMQEPINGDSLEGDPMADIINSATPYNSDFDVIDNNTTEDAVQVLRVSYDKNLKNGKVYNRGNAYVIIPMVDPNGDVKDESRTIPFYLDGERNPIINNTENMLKVVYDAIVAGIKNDPVTANIDIEGTANEPAGDVNTIASVTSEVPAEDNLMPTEDPNTIAQPENDPITVSTSTPSDEDNEMFGLDADPEVPVDDSIFNDNSENTDVTPKNEVPVASSNDSEVNNDNMDNDSVEQDPTSAKEESPAEVQERDNKAQYPIELGLNINDIKPIKMTSFTDALDDMGIEHAEVEGESDSVTMKFANKAAVYALKDYFNEWKGWNDASFVSFFPELKKCFANKPTNVEVAPANESVNIVNVKGINESKLYERNNKGTVTLVLPYTDDYAKIFGYSKNNPKMIKIITESVNESKELYNTLYLYSKINEKIDESAKKFLKKYEKDFADIVNEAVHIVEVPYNGFLTQKLSSKGILSNHIDESLSIPVNSSNIKKVKKIFESFYGEKTPIEVKDFFQLAESSLNEELKIRIEDTETKQSIELSGLSELKDVLNKDKNSSSEDEKEETSSSDPFKDSNVTFTQDNALMKSEDDDSAKEELNDENTEEDKLNKDIESKSTNKEDTEEEEKHEKKKIFRFKPKSKNESVKVERHSNVLNESTLNESAVPNVLDWVEPKNGTKWLGQVIGKLPMSDNLIVNICGSNTIEVNPKDIKLVHERPDTVECPYKFDPATLKGLFEQMVHCGLFMNNNRITPNDCFTKYSDYINAKDDDDIRLVVENEQVFAKKKYIKITEEINDFANVNDYVDGIEVSDSGIELRKLLINIKDFNNAKGMIQPVRVLISDDTGEKHLTNLPVGSLRLIEM